MDFKASKPDGRILILQIIITYVLSFYFENKWAVICFFLIINFLVSFWFSAKMFFKTLFIYFMLNAIVWILMKVDIPVISAVFQVFLMMIIRVFPVYLLLKLLIDKTPMNELLYCLEVIHIPKSLLIPLMVVYRYVSTIMEEFRYINESLKMRGLNLTFKNAKNLIKTLENYMVPLLFRSEKISEELSAASLCKGLSTEHRRSCCTDVRLTVTDILYVLMMISVISGLLYLNYLNF